MSPIVTSIASAPGFFCSCATMSAESSMPATGTPRRLSGRPMRPVPMANSNARPSPANDARKSTVSSTTAGWDMPVESSS